MELNEFISKNNIDLDKKFKKLCLEGINIMKKSKDPQHSINHINAIFDDLDKFIQEEKVNINYSILLPAICWHDVWKSKKEQSSNLLFYIVEQFYDGYGSKLIFNKKVLKYKLNNKLQKKIAYSIHKHSLAASPFFKKFELLFPIHYKECKILRDLDTLYSWSPNAIDTFEKAYLYGSNPKGAYMIGVYWYKKVLQKTNENQFYYNWSRNEFNKRKDEIKKRALTIIQSKKKYYK
ncbi:hypothetical protein HOD20_00820 [archaeon]|nr:hypothetical protein [archaeon]MBT4648541.1 hypothetical protein [archaeon]MBT6821360.1 hypothetical protein [archaeon]